MNHWTTSFRALAHKFLSAAQRVGEGSRTSVACMHASVHAREHAPAVARHRLHTTYDTQLEAGARHRRCPTSTSLTRCQDVAGVSTHATGSTTFRLQATRLQQGGEVGRRRRGGRRSCGDGGRHDDDHRWASTSVRYRSIQMWRVLSHGPSGSSWTLEEAGRNWISALLPTGVGRSTASFCS